MHTHLAYALVRPAEPGDVQRELGIRSAASYIVAVKNPEEPSPGRAGLSVEQTAFYPRELQEKFRNRRWAEAEPAHLDREGAELLLVAADEDPERALGIRLEPGDEATPDVFRALGLDRRSHPVAPLLSGDCGVIAAGRRRWAPVTATRRRPRLRGGSARATRDLVARARDRGGAHPVRLAGELEEPLPLRRRRVVRLEAGVGTTARGPAARWGRRRR